MPFLDCSSWRVYQFSELGNTSWQLKDFSQKKQCLLPSEGLACITEDSLLSTG